MLVRVIWDGSLEMAILDGLEAMPELAEAWHQHGPPAAISLAGPDGVTTAVYARNPRRLIPGPTLVPPPPEPVVLVRFYSRRFGDLWWFTDTSTKDLLCLISECGLPTDLLLVHNNVLLDAICKRRTRRIPPVVQLLALEASLAIDSSRHIK